MSAGTTRTDSVATLIVGAGPCGLGAATALDGLGETDWLLCERTGGPGGLSRSFADTAGFTWDLGGHVLFSHYAAFDEALARALPASEWLEHERESWIRSDECWVPYPFQNNLHRLPRDETARCLAGLVAAALAQCDEATAPASFDEYLERTFGEGIAETFMRPYNRKVWAHPLEDMSCTWTGERVAVPDPVRAVVNAVNRTDDAGWGPNATFRYPAHGGTGAIWEALARLLPPERLSFGRELVAVDVDAREASFSDGSTIGYGTLVTTLPLDRLCAITGREEWAVGAARLSHSSVHVLGFGFSSTRPETLGTRCWMYFPSPDAPFYRVTQLSHYSPHMTPSAEGWSLMCEVSESAHRPVDVQRLPDVALASLREAGLAPVGAMPDSVWTHRIEHAYPTPTLPRDGIVLPLLRELGEHGILSRGRFGAWRYEVANMDHSFMQGYEAARHIVSGEPEVTVWDPARVNALKAGR